MNHYPSLCRSHGRAATITSSPKQRGEPNTVSTGGMTTFMSTMMATAKVTSPDSAKPFIQAIKTNTMASVTTLPMPHYIYSKTEGAWKQQKPRGAPVLTVSLSLDRAAYGELKLCPPKLVKRAGSGHARARRATTDTGAQLVVINISELHTMGIKSNSIFPVATALNTVTKAPVDLVGGLFLVITDSMELQAHKVISRLRSPFFRNITNMNPNRKDVIPGVFCIRLSISINPNGKGCKGHNSLGYMFMRLSTSINPNETGGNGHNSLG